MKNVKPARFLIVFPFLHSWEPIQLPNLLLKGSHEIENEPTDVRKHLHVIPHFIRDAHVEPTNEFLYGWLHYNEAQNDFDTFAQRLVQTIEVLRWVLFDPFNRNLQNVPFYEQTIFYTFDLEKGHTVGPEQLIGYGAGINFIPRQFMSERFFQLDRSNPDIKDFDVYNFFSSHISCTEYERELEQLHKQVVEKGDERLYLAIWWYNQSFKNQFWNPLLSIVALHTSLESLYRVAEIKNAVKKEFVAMCNKAQKFLAPLSKYGVEEEFLKTLPDELYNWAREFERTRNSVVHGTKKLKEQPSKLTVKELSKRKERTGETLDRSFWYTTIEGREYLPHIYLARLVHRLSLIGKDIGITPEEAYSHLTELNDLFNPPKVIIEKIKSKIKKWDKKSQVPYLPFIELNRPGPVGNWEDVKEILRFLYEAVETKHPSLWQTIQKDANALLQNLDRRKEKFRECAILMARIGQISRQYVVPSNDQDFIVHSFESSPQNITSVKGASTILTHLKLYLQFIRKVLLQDD